MKINQINAVRIETKWIMLVAGIATLASEPNKRLLHDMVVLIDRGCNYPMQIRHTDRHKQSVRRLLNENIIVF